MLQRCSAMLLLAATLLVWVPDATATQIRVAVSYFENASGKPAMESLKKGLTAMLITDLSASKDIALVERGRLNDVLNEIELQKSPYFDGASASKLGKGLGASFIVTGSYIVQGTTMRVDARLIDVQTSEIVVSTKAEGDISAFLKVQRKLAIGLLGGIGAQLNLLERKRIGLRSTTNYGAFQAYSRGLDQLDEGKTGDALESLARAVEVDPAFKQAKALRDRVAKLSKVFNLKTLADQIPHIADYLVGETCDCSFVELPGDPPMKSWSATLRRARRLEVPLLDVTGCVANTEDSHNTLSDTIVQLAKWGLFEEAEALVGPTKDSAMVQAQRSLSGIGGNDKRSACRFTESTATAIKQSEPIRQAARNGEAEERIRAVTRHGYYVAQQLCIVYQTASWIYYRQLKLDEAMEWQIASDALPFNDGVDPRRGQSNKSVCMGPMLLQMSNIPVSTSMRTHIETASTDHEAYRKLREEYDELRRFAPQARRALEEAMKTRTCQQVCPWDK